MDWDDLRIILQLVRAKQMTAAAKALGVDDSTVGRRVARLEKAIGAPLVERAGRRTVITEQGQKVAKAAERIESVILREITGLGEEASLVAGRVRIGAPEGFGVGYLARRLAELSLQYERLETELIALPRTYSLATREVDIAITLERPRTGQLTVRKLIDYALQIYGTDQYFEARGTPAATSDLKRHTLAGYIPELLFTEELSFDTVGDGEKLPLAVRSTSVIAQVNAVLSGAAIGILPRYLAAAHPELRPILTSEVHFVRSYWIAVHDDLKHFYRVRAVLDAIVSRVRQDASIFAGP
ncbi:transcriptional regulator [Hansschlegelia plantiphila]|uniref:Transcriptional regulator n=2 Tax=Hansschlegelia plantiphila TaxID=374655 RepID=A0A9W6J0T0_9HYPH|nr:transcriptional regulator [Hansschlegelia plantiphila]